MATDPVDSDFGDARLGSLPSQAKKAVMRRSATSSLNSSDLRNGRHGVMAKYLYKQIAGNQWCDPPQDEDGNPVPEFVATRGVVMQREDGSFVTYPHNLTEDVANAVLRLDVPIAFTMSSTIVSELLHSVAPDQAEFGDLKSGVVLPIIDSVNLIASGEAHIAREQFICLCRREQFLLIWGDSVENILAQGTDIETWLVGLVWGSAVHPATGPSPRHSTFGMRTGQVVTPPIPIAYSTPVSGQSSEPQFSEKEIKTFDVIQTAIAKEEEGDKAYDPEKDGTDVPQRSLLLWHAGVISLAMVLVVVVEFACIAKLLTEVRLDGSYLRFALVLTVPVFGAFSLFFMIVITGSVFQLFGPLSSIQSNSVFYSAKAPKLGRHKEYELPHVTIQMPVYKEGLKGVIMPTIESCMAAVRYYEARGGTASIFVNDDGMQLAKPEIAEARQAYYELNSIGWCSRPPHNSDEESESYFVRAGKFKKASNMNYCLDFSGRIEDEWLRLLAEECEKRGCTQDDLSVGDEEDLYDRARETMIEKDGGKTWAAGNVRMGEVILIIDSDTRVPEDSLLYGALEMHESPEVALLQHASGILQVANNVFERGLTYFTNLIYTSIQFAVGSGDCAPFVGHNTFIRWKAIQAISWEEDGRTLFWSESHVSEDFDVSLRLQMNNFVVRLATYHNGAFKEGVSLTVYDELARWEKYAYGCNELVFHPFRYWFTKSPLTPLFRRFLSIGWFADEVDQFYITSWKIFVGMAVVFNVLSPLAYAMLRHRLGQKTFFVCVWETMKWTPMFVLFFGGLSFHMCKALFCHACSINMEWTTTAKELETSGFRVGLDRIVRDFKYMYAFLIPVTGGMIYLAGFAPRSWIISDFAAIVPLANQIGCHALLPFALGLF